MKESAAQDLFELVRKAPTELSQKQVMQLITTLPSLPPPGQSWFKIHLNSIIMTTTVTAVLTSAVLYFSGPNEAELLPGQEQLQNPGMEQVSPPTTSLPTQDSLEIIESIPDPVGVANPDQTTPQSLTIPLTTGIKEKKSEPDKVRQPDVLVQQVQGTQTNSTANPIHTQTSSSSSTSGLTTSAVGDASSSLPTAELNELSLKKLKRELLRELSADKLIDDKRALNVLEYKRNEIFVNNQRLDYQGYNKYNEFLAEYNISPGPDRRVVTEARYIMVGDFLEESFKGSLQGTAMDLRFIEDNIIQRGLLSPQTETPDEQTVMISSEKDEDEPGDLFVRKAGDPDAKVTNLSGIGRAVAGDRPDPADNVNFGSFFKQSKTVFSRDDVNDPVEINTRKIKSLKKELYKMLLKDDQIASKNVEVVMTIDLSPFKVNRNNALQPQVQSRYETLLKKYNISRARNRKIIMNPDFILAGDFQNGQFTGTVQGNLDQDQLNGSLLEDELKNFLLFSNGQTGQHSTNHNQPGIYQVAKESRDIAPFDHLKVSGIAVVYLTQGPHRSARLEVSGMPIDEVYTDSDDGTLHVYTKGNYNGESISVYISSPDLYTIEAHDAAEVFGENPLKSHKLKIIAAGSGAVELGVDAGRLHLQMDGGDIHLEGKATMEKIDFLSDSDNGDLDQSGLNVLENWTAEGSKTWTEQNLDNFREVLMNQLVEDNLVTSARASVSISFFKDRLEVNGNTLDENQLEIYRNILDRYGLEMKYDRKLWITRDFIVLADKVKGNFELKVIGSELEFGIEGNWHELEEAILNY